MDKSQYSSGEDISQFQHLFQGLNTKDKETRVNHLWGQVFKRAFGAQIITAKY